MAGSDSAGSTAQTAAEPGGGEATGRTLVLLRHAKAVRDPQFADHQRPLTDRGWRDAVAAGQLLRSRGFTADRVLCSTALRAQQTWNGTAQGGGEAAEVLYLEDVYEATLSRLVALVRRQPDTVQRLMVVGHGPGIPDLAEHISDRSSVDVARARMNRKFSTCALATFSCPDSWAALGRSQAQLVAFDIPRG